MPRKDVEYYERAALESRRHSQEWFRCMSRIFTPNGRTLPQKDIDALLQSDKLSMYQKVTLLQANIVGSPTNRYVISLNQKAKTHNASNDG